MVHQIESLAGIGHVNALALDDGVARLPVRRRAELRGNDLALTLPPSG